MPLRDNDGNAFSIYEFEVTREELLARFDAVSLEPGPIRGIWIHERLRYDDENARIFVDCEDTVESERFFRSYKETLKERFRQLEMWITVHPIRVL